MKSTIVPCIIKSLARLPLPVARALGTVIGRCVWLSKGRPRERTLKNIGACFPHLSSAEIQTFAQASLIETAKTIAEAPIIWRNSWEWLSSKIVAVEGEDILRAELAKGQGLVALAPHLGNWEVIAPYLASIAPLAAMYAPTPCPAVDEIVLLGRSKCNITMAPTNRKGVCILLKTLQQGNIVGILPDQVPKKDAGCELAPFFDQEALSMTLVHSLISRTQSRVISLFAKRVPGGFKIIVLPADDAIYSDDIAQSVLGLNKSIENCVHLAPTQYQWEYNRFRFPVGHQEARKQKQLAFSCKKNWDSPTQ